MSSNTGASSEVEFSSLISITASSFTLVVAEHRLSLMFLAMEGQTFRFFLSAKHQMATCMNCSSRAKVFQEKGPSRS